MTEATRVRAVLAYDGSAFRGFAENPGVRTVAGDVRAVIERVLQQEVSITCAGRTDKGVHAWGQVISFDVTSPRFNAAKLKLSINSMCRPEIVVRELEVVEPTFDARHDASMRLYRYRIFTGEAMNPTDRFTHWHVREPLDVDAMRQAAKHLHGTHDFSSFCRRPVPRADGAPVTLHRTLLRTDFTVDGDLLLFEIEGTAFCQQMVRSITGTLVEVGLGERSIDSLPDTIAARERTTAGDLAPPHGLTLWHVSYPRPTA